MSIPEQKLDTWSHQGAVATSKRTHEAIRRALRKWDALDNRNYEVYLQGSYKNSTNIRGSSDVDVVAQTNDSFHSNVSSDLPPVQREAYHNAYSSATYSLEQFRQDVIEALRDYFGSRSVTEGNKAIKVARGSNRLPADVVVCAQYHRYSYFHSLQNYSMIEGMTFRTRDGRWIINYPKQHYSNGVQKNNGCIRSYKAGVRVFKNARNEAIRRQWIPEARVPSYFLECFAYNASNGCYSGSWQELYLDVLDELTNGDYSKYTCQNGVIRLFGQDRDHQWDESSAKSLVSALWRLWKEW